MSGLKAKAFLVFLPNGRAVEIQPADAKLEQDKTTGMIRAITHRQPDGSCRRYEGFPVVIETHPPQLVETVAAMPAGLVKGH